MFNEIYKRIDRIISFFTSNVSLDNVTESYKKRLLDMKNIYLSPTNVYSPSYYLYRLKKFNYANRNHNYYLTGKFMNTLSILKTNDNKIVLKTEADYYKYLLDRFFVNVYISFHDMKSIVEDYKKFINV